MASDLLARTAMNGDNKLPRSLISHVGAGSSWQVLFNDELINFSISSAVTGLQSLSRFPENELMEWTVFDTIVLSNSAALDSGEKEVFELLTDIAVLLKM